MASSNAQHLRQMFLGAQLGTTSSNYHSNGNNSGGGQDDKENSSGGVGNSSSDGGNFTSGFTVNPLFQNAKGAVAAQANGMAYREESAAQVGKRVGVRLGSE